LELTVDWEIENLLRDSREAEGRARDYERRASRARRDATKARLKAWRILAEEGLRHATD